MDQVERLRGIVDPSIKISKICTSYLTRLFPEYKDSPCIILHKEVRFVVKYIFQKFILFDTYSLFHLANCGA